MTTLYLENESTIENPTLAQLLTQETLLDVLSDTLVITSKGTLFDLQSNRSSTQIKDLCV